MAMDLLQDNKGFGFGPAGTTPPLLGKRSEKFQSEYHRSRGMCRAPLALD